MKNTTMFLAIFCLISTFAKAQRFCSSCRTGTNDECRVNYVSDIPLTTATESQLDEINQIYNRLSDRILGKTKPNNLQTSLNTAISNYNKLEISVTNGNISGNITGGIRDPSKILRSFAQYIKFRPTASEVEDIKKKASNLVWLILKKNCDGSLPIVSYQDYREFMKPVTFLLDYVSDDSKTGFYNLLHNFGGLGAFYNDNYSEGDGIFSADMMRSSGISLTGYAKFLNDDNEKVRWMKGITRLMNRCFTYSRGGSSGIKPDGSGFHHLFSYPGYMGASYTTCIDIIVSLDNTSFQISKDSYLRFRDAIYYQRIIGNDAGMKAFSMSGRFPQGRGLGGANIQAIGDLAIIGGKILGLTTADPVLAGYVNRIVGRTNPKFNYTKVTPFEEGYIQFNHTEGGVYRKDNYLVFFNGFSSSTFGIEGFEGNNLFGRYQSYGAMEIIVPGNTNTEENGFDTNTWNWNYNPGTTTIVLPWKDLEKRQNYGSQQKRFVGSLSLKNKRYPVLTKVFGTYGLFAMDFQEARNKNPTFIFKKSNFTFSDMIVCLGSGINNNNTRNNTVTTLYQRLVNSRSVTVNGTVVTAGSKTFTGSNNWVISNANNGFYVVNGGDIKVWSGTSPTGNHQSDPGSITLTTDFKPNTYGYIDHGNSPSNVGYEYICTPKTTVKKMTALHTSMQDSNNRPYIVHQKNANAHIVEHKKDKIWGYSLFSTNSNINHTGSLIKGNDKPCLAMYQKTNANNILLSVTNPDWGFDGGWNGKSNNSIVSIDVRLTLRGKLYLWSPPDSNVRIVGYTNNDSDTVMEFKLTDGLPVEVRLGTSKFEVQQDTPNNFVTSWTVSNTDKSIVFPGTGSYTINWGDESTVESATGNISHTYASAGIYTVTVSNGITKFISGNSTNAPKLTLIEQWGTAQWTSMHSAFKGATNMVYNATDAPNLSSVTDMEQMFRGTSLFNPDTAHSINSWNVSNVQFMNLVFAGATTFNSDISSWNVSNVTRMIEMFSGAMAFDGDISSWNVSKVANMSKIFQNTPAFTQNLGTWFITPDTFTVNEGVALGSVVGTITTQGNVLTEPTITYTLSGGTDRDKFSITPAGVLTAISESLSSISPYSIEIKASGNLGRTLTYTKQVTINIHDLDPFITTWTVTGSDKSINFPGSGSYTINWGDESTVESATKNISHTYANAGTYTVTVSNGITKFAIKRNSTNTPKLTSIEQWGTAQWTTMRAAFIGASNMVYNATDTPNLSSVTDMDQMFRGASAFNATNLNSWNVSNIEGMNLLFYEATVFNGDISSWNVSNVIRMNAMFSAAKAFNGDISNWNVSKVTDMHDMFHDARSFIQNLGRWFITPDTFTVNGGVALGSVVGTITTQGGSLTDPTITYTISGGTDAGKFNLTSAGQLTINESPSFSTQQSYSIEVTAIVDTGRFGRWGVNFTRTRIVNITVVPPPTVTITSSSGDSGTGTTSATLNYTATFSEAVTGFGIADITVTGTANKGNPMASNFVAVTGDTTYTFDVVRGLSDGTVSVSIASGVATGINSNLNSVSSNIYELTIATIPVLNTPSVLPYYNPTEELSIQFSAYGASPLIFSLTGDVPQGITIDKTSGLLIWTPTESQVGTHSVTVSVSNSLGEDSETIIITVGIDTDGDGVFDNIDTCPNTPSGKSVNAVGCIQLSSNNFEISSTTPRCPGVNNGKISIKNLSEWRFDFVITGPNSYNNTFENKLANESFVIEGLAVGTYNIIAKFSTTGIGQDITGFQAIISSATPVSGINKSIDIVGKSSVFTVSGDKKYSIFVNDVFQRSETFSDEGQYEITVNNLSVGKNHIKIIPENKCRGLIEGWVIIPNSNVKFYPNPAIDLFHIGGLESSDITVQIFAYNGQRVYRKNHKSVNGIVYFSIRDLPAGLYIVRVSSKKVGDNINFKITKR